MIESLELFNNQAIHLASHGEYQEAIACFKKALQFEQSNYLLWFNMGVTYRDSGDFDKARFALEKAFVLAQQCGENGEDVAEVLAQMLFANGQYGEAIKYCNIGLTINIRNSHIWNTLGAVLFNLESYDKAAEAFENALTISPYYYDALFNLHDTYAELGNEDGKRVCEIKMSELQKKDL